MFRCLELAGIENITRLILNAIIKAGELRFEGQMEFGLAWVTVKNKNEVAEHFSKAMKAVLLQNDFFSKVYLKLDLTEKNRMITEIAEHFIKVYPDSFLHVDCLNVRKDQTYSAYLLEEIFWSYLTNKQSREARYEKIHEILIKQINIPLATFFADVHYQKQFSALATGYADTHSIFSRLPKELIIEIGRKVNSVHAQETLSQPTC
jgi:hypothetical protein